MRHAVFMTSESTFEIPAPVLTIAAAGQALLVSRPTVLKLLDLGHLRQIRIGRRRLVEAASLAEFIARGGSDFEAAR
jgi:excisionase family DNA binding protein